MHVTIEPEPPEHEQEAILAALLAGREPVPGEWARAALAEAVEEELDP